VSQRPVVAKLVSILKSEFGGWLCDNSYGSWSGDSGALCAARLRVWR